MRSKSTFIAGLGAVAALSGPVALASADAPAAPGEPKADAKAHSASTPRRAAHRRHVKRTLRLARTEARLQGKRLRPGYKTAISSWSNERLIGRQRTLRRNIGQLRRFHVPGAMRARLARIAQCESGGNPRAVGGGGRYRGLFQFDMSTWRGVGGKGDPARASVREQYFRAYKLMRARGSSPWPVCG